MVLEPMSDPSDAIREGVEKGKFRVGLNDEARKPTTAGDGEKTKKKRDLKKPKGPNPLSVKKPKKRAPEDTSGKAEKPKREAEERPAAEERDGEDGDAAPKAKRRRRHHNRGAGKTDGDEGGAQEAAAPADAMDD